MGVVQFTGQLLSSPGANEWPSGDQTLLEPFKESLLLALAPLVCEVQLSTDDPVAVPLGVGAPLTGANILVLRANGGKVRARITTTDGAAQAVPVDPLGILISASVPITALDLTRVAGSGNTVSVKVFLGQA